jgi:hypothetical protein
MRTYEDLLDEITALQKENDEYKAQLISVHTGISNRPVMEFISEGGDWRIVFKKSSRKVPLTHYVSRENVFVLYSLIKEGTNTEKLSISYRELVPELIRKHNLDLGIDEFNGGHHRGEYYAYYYLPARILQHLNLINYSNKGVISIKDRNLEL